MHKTKSARPIMYLISIYLFTPLLMTFIYSISTEWTEIMPTGFTLKNYQVLFTDQEFWISLGRTIIISILPVALTTGMLLMAMYVAVVYVPQFDKLLNVLCTIPYAIQGVILPISVISLYTSAPGLLSNRVLLLICTYCIVILPYMYQGIKNSLATVDTVRIIEAAEMLGASKFYAFFKIIVPHISKSVLLSSLLAVAIIFGDFVIVNTIAGNYFTTAQVYLYRYRSVSGQMTSSIIVVLFLVTLIISMIALKKEKE